MQISRELVLAWSVSVICHCQLKWFVCIELNYRFVLFFVFNPWPSNFKDCNITSLLLEAVTVAGEAFSSELVELCLVGWHRRVMPVRCCSRVGRVLPEPMRLLSCLTQFWLHYWNMWSNDLLQRFFPSKGHLLGQAKVLAVQPPALLSIQTYRHQSRSQLCPMWTCYYSAYSIFHVHC